MPSTTIKGKAKIVCGAKKCAGFKSQSKSKLPFAGKALPLGCIAAYLQREFASIPPQWGAGMATWTRCPILHAPQQTASFSLPCFLINMNHEFDLARKTIAKVLAFQPLEKPASFPKPWLNMSPPFPYAAPAAR